MQQDYTRGQEQVARDLLRLIATTSDTIECLKRLLALVREAHGIEGSRILVYELPETVNPDDPNPPLAAAPDAMRALIESQRHAPIVRPDLPLESAAWSLLIPIGSVGALYLWSREGETATDDALLDSFADAARIVFARLYEQARFLKLNRNQNEFMRIVSHDLRSPLTSMQGFASMLELGLVGELNEKQLQFVEKILSGITQITMLVDNIQDAGRYDPETGFYEMSRSHCDLSEMVRKIVENHLVPAEKQELSISFTVAPDVPIIDADSNMLERAITNLVDNAIKYTPNGGNVVVEVFVENGSVVVSVRDTGLGISAEQQRQLFQRHVRLARQEYKKIKGSGLGLFIVRSVAQRHGGSAWVQSAEGKGSTFSFSIPLAGANLVGGDT